MPAIKYGTNEIRTTFNEGGQNYVELTEAEISQGFVPLTPVDAEPCNFIQNRADADINFLKRQCGAEWRSDTDYVVNNTVISPLYGFYRCVISNTGVNPDTDTGGRWVFVQTPVPDASETVKGILKISTSAIALAGTDNTTAISPKKLKVVLDGQTPTNAINLETTDLNTLSSESDAGIYFQGTNANTTGKNYPVPYAGSLSVSISSGVTQKYTVYSVGGASFSGKIYTRGFSISGIWSSWRDISGGTDIINPVGSLMQFPTNNIPDGYLVTDFSAVSRVGFSALFAVIGTTFGAGDGSTTFNLPPFDNDGAFLRGSGGNAAALGVLQGDAIRNITGKVQGRGLFTTSTASASGALAIDSYTNNDSAPGSIVITNNAFRLDASLQVPTAPENRPLNYSIKICIKF